MAINPLDELNINSSDNQESKSDNESKSLIKKLKANPVFKELKNPLIFAGIALVAIVFTLTYLNNSSKPTYFKNALTAEKDAKQLITSSENLVSNISSLENENKNLQTMISEKRNELADADLVRTPLEQGFYFIAYFDSLVKSLDMNLIKMEVVANDETTGQSVDLTQNTSAGVSGEVNYDLLPIYVEFETTYENLMKLFSQFYTKRIVYDNNLKIENRFDGSVYVSMTVTFEGGTNNNESIGNEQIQWNTGNSNQQGGNSEIQDPNNGQEQSDDNGI